MKLYDIEYSYDKEDEGENQPEGMLEGELTEENDSPIVMHIDTHMQLGCEDFDSAVNEATFMLDEVFGEEVEYRILCVQEVQNVDILNWPGEGEPCPCPYCKAERAAEEDIMKFDCPYCGDEIRVVDGDWDHIPCIECGETIYHDNIINLGRNKYKAIKIQDRKD